MKRLTCLGLGIAASLLSACEPAVVHRSPYSVAVQAALGDGAMARRRALEHCQQFDRTSNFIREKCFDAVCSEKVHYFTCE